MAKRKKPKLRNKVPPPSMRSVIGLWAIGVISVAVAVAAYYLIHAPDIELTVEMEQFLPVLYYLPIATLGLAVYYTIRLIIFRRKGRALEEKRRFQKPKR